KKEPGCTPSLMPGLHRRPESSRGLGSSSHRSPGSSWVRACRSLSLGCSVSGPTVADILVGQSTTREEAASTSWLRKRSEVYMVPTRMPSEAAEHFWPACPKALCTRSATARSRSAAGVITMAFLPEVSALICRSGRQDANIAAVSDDPVRITRSTFGWLTNLRPASRLAGYTQCNTRLGTPASHSASTTAAEQCWLGFDGLWMTPAPAASAAKVDPAGMAMGKF